MIYKLDDENIPKRWRLQDHKDYLEKLKAAFPSSFGENARPIMVQLSQKFQRPLQRFVAKQVDKGPVGNAIERPPSSHASAIEKVIRDGAMEIYGFSTTVPRLKPNERWSPKSIELAKRSYLDPQRDLELLAFLYFFSSEFSNGARASERVSQNARFEFIMPEKQAEQDFDKIIQDQRAYDYLINPKTRDSYENVVNIAKAISFGTSGIEQRDRADLFAHLTKHQNAKENLAHYERIRVTVSPSGKNPFDLTAIDKKVKDAIAAGFIVEKDSNWVLQSSGGDAIAKITGVKGHQKKEKVMHLVAHLQVDPTIVEQINELLSVPA